MKLINKILNIALFILFLGITIQSGYAFSGGDGTSGNPLLISTCQEFYDVGGNLSATNTYYALSNSIDCKNITWNYWTDTYPFNLNGNNYTVYNLSYESGLNTGILLGYMGSTFDVVIENIAFVDVNKSCTQANCGVLIGAMGNSGSNVTISNVRLDGVLTTVNSYHGGLVGWKNNGYINVQNTVINLNITGVGNQAGGFFGFLNRASSYTTLNNTISTSYVNVASASYCDIGTMGGGTAYLIQNSYGVGSRTTNGCRLVTVTTESSQGNQSAFPLLDFVNTWSITTGFPFLQTYTYLEPPIPPVLQMNNAYILPSPANASTPLEFYGNASNTGLLRFYYDVYKNGALYTSGTTNTDLFVNATYNIPTWEVTQSSYMFGVTSDFINNKVYFGFANNTGNGGRWGVYDVASNTTTELSTTDVGDWLGSFDIYRMYYEPVNDLVFLTSPNNFKFGYYDVSANITYQINDTSGVFNVVSDNVTGLVYYSWGNNVNTYNYTSNTTALAFVVPTGGYAIQSLYKKDNLIFYGSNVNGSFGYYNITNSVVTDLQETDTGDFFVGNNIESITDLNGQIYFIGNSGWETSPKVGVYNFDTNTTTDITSNMNLPSSTGYLRLFTINNNINPTHQDFIGVVSLSASNGTRFGIYDDFRQTSYQISASTTFGYDISYNSFDNRVYYAWYGHNFKSESFYIANLPPSGSDVLLGTLPAYTFQHNDNITLSVIANNYLPDTNSTPLNSSTITLINSIPTVSPIISPSVPYTYDTLVCNPNGFDADNEGLSYTYNWYLNTVYNSSTQNITSGLSPGQEWYCQAQAYDGYDYSFLVSSPTVTILIPNIQPVMNTIRFNPTSVYPNQSFNVYLNASDINGDNLRYSYEVYLNGALNSSGVLNEIGFVNNSFLLTDTGLTSALSIAGINIGTGVSVDTNNNLVYIALSTGTTPYGYFFVYNPETNISTDLTPYAEAVNITRSYESIYYDNYYDLLYLGGIGNTTNETNVRGLTVYNPSDNSVTDLVANNLVDNCITTNVFNGEMLSTGNDNLYIGGSNGKLCIYNRTSGLVTDLNEAWIGTSLMRTLRYDDVNNLVFFSGTQGKYGYYNISSQTLTDLTDTDVGNWISTNFAYLEVVNGLAYLFIGSNNYIGVYNFTTNTTDFITTIEPNTGGGVNGFSLQYDTINNLMYVSGKNYFTSYDITTNTTTDLTQFYNNIGYLTSSFTNHRILSYNGVSRDYIFQNNRFGYYSLYDLTDFVTEGVERFAVNISNVEHNDIWNITAYAYDGEYNSTIFSNIMSVTNYPPIVNPYFSPLIVYDDGILTCYGNGTDFDNDSLTYTYEWFENDVNVASTQNITGLTSGAEYNCEAKAFDGTDYSTSVNTTKVTVLSQTYFVMGEVSGISPDGGIRDNVIPVTCYVESYGTVPSYNLVYKIDANFNGTTVNIGYQTNNKALFDLALIPYGSNVSFTCGVYDGVNWNNNFTTTNLTRGHETKLIMFGDGSNEVMNSNTKYNKGLYADFYNEPNVTILSSFADCNGDDFYDYYFTYDDNRNITKEYFSCYNIPGIIPHKVGVYINKTNSASSVCGDKETTICKIERVYGVLVK